MSPARTPDPNGEARQRRHAAAKAKKLLREGMARLQAVLDDRFIIDETPLGRAKYSETQCATRTFAVVVSNPFAQDRAQMCLRLALGLGKHGESLMIDC